MIIQMAGLPGTGKSTLSTALARELPGLVLDKDRVRQAHFTTAVSYTREQDDFCVELLVRTAAYLLRRDPRAVVILDGRTCLQTYQVTQVRRFAASLGQPLHLIECVCAEATAHARLESDRSHPAADRTVALYQRLRREAQPITGPKLTIDTDADPRTVLTRCLDALHTATHPPVGARPCPTT